MLTPGVEYNSYRLSILVTVRPLMDLQSFHLKPSNLRNYLTQCIKSYK